jgi:predicted nucleic acid-binding protein
MIYFDASYVARLYLEDPGWETVGELAARNPVTCCVHGHAEVIAAFHRKLREGVFSPVQYKQVLEQFEVDCGENAYRWLPLSPAVTVRLSKAFLSLPKTVFLRSADALHLACAAENSFKEVYSNDQRLLAAASHFGLRGLDVI